MEKDLKILNSILKELNFTDKYIEILLNNIKNRLIDSKLEEITPNLIYNSLIYDLGSNESRKISNYFLETKKNGQYETELEKLFNKKSHN
jgi:hypothetical protein